MIESLLPVRFESDSDCKGAEIYLRNAATRRLIEFFEKKGLAKLKQEDRAEAWYDDWIQFQAEHQIYASLISPKKYSSSQTGLDLLRVVRFVEAFAYFSPAHGYSFQVSFLGLFPIFMSTNEALKKEVTEKLQAGSVFAFGVSEKAHGSDLYGNEFSLTESRNGNFLAQGNKYYIGNANCAEVISVLAKKIREGDASSGKKKPFVFFALRPKSQPLSDVKKIQTLGVRAGFVGNFRVENQEVSEKDIISEGRKAWDSLFTTISLGKFFLGFGSIGICERSFEETVQHTKSRILYGKSVSDLPHIHSALSQAYVKIAAMKFYAYRSVDYFISASSDDRRYLLFSAVQKNKVSTEGVKVMDILSTCMGARGFEAETYFESALRDIQLIPSLESSTHINLGLTLQFMKNYFFDAADLPSPASFVSEEFARENPYFFEAESSGINRVQFPGYLQAYRPLLSDPNVRAFTRQTKNFRRFLVLLRKSKLKDDQEFMLEVARTFSIIVYAQLIAEQSVISKSPPDLTSAIFHHLVEDLSAAALRLRCLRPFSFFQKLFLTKMIQSPRNTDVAFRISTF